MVVSHIRKARFQWLPVILIINPNITEKKHLKRNIMIFYKDSRLISKKNIFLIGLIKGRLLRSRGLLWLPASTDGAAPPEPGFVMIACVHIRCGAYGAGFVVMAGVY